MQAFVPRQSLFLGYVLQAVLVRLWCSASKKSTAGAVVVPFRVLSRNNMTKNI